MKYKFGLIILLVLVALFVTNIIKQSFEENEKVDGASISYEEDLTKESSVLKKNEVAPNITLKTLDGKDVQLADLKGKNIVLNFWATWCPPCKREMPDLQKYYTDYKDQQNVVVIGANLTFSKDSKEKVESFIESYDLSFPIYLIEDKDVLDLYRITTIPSTFFIDIDGRVQRKMVGPLTTSSLESYVDELIDSFKLK
jgi:thiol-disulfide isomerase/thioredoxin